MASPKLRYALVFGASSSIRRKRKGCGGGDVGVAEVVLWKARFSIALALISKLTLTCDRRIISLSTVGPSKSV